ncbi:hypothetical protein E3U43_010293 [Larimichthys crocea]|uniref:Uncharacterized protein n=1 Tax=Larimichthys crocea TaxID=215358 RepID=A0ACD3RF41_LARCR|nr:hypothetical protein E3U43_010293 [Larimichthys crocea]
MKWFFVSMFAAHPAVEDPAHHSDISIDQSGPDRTSVSLVPDQSLSSSASSSSHSSSQGDGADSPDVNASGGYSHTDLVTMAADSTGADTVSADPTGRPLDSTNPAVTDHTQAAGSVTEQYNPSGQGPEGAENVELEDTC